MNSQPKYRVAYAQLEQLIQEGCWAEGGRLPSEKELSRRLGVSYMTMRRAIGDLEAEGRLRRVPGSGTYIQEAQPSRPQPTFALVLPKLWQRLDPHYFPDIVRGLQEEAEAKGVVPLVTDSDAAALPTRIPVAVLLIERADMGIVDSLKAQGHPVVAVNRYSGRHGVPWITPDNRGGTQRAVEHLLAAGHERIAFLRGNPLNLDAEERLQGYRRAMRLAGLHPMEAGAGFSERSGELAARELLRVPRRPSALVAASDRSAIGALRFAREEGLSVPGDLSIIGFGNFGIRVYISPLLTTVELPRVELGRRVCQALFSLAQGVPVRTQTLPTPLMPGQTDGPPALSIGSVTERRLIP